MCTLHSKTHISNENGQQTTLNRPVSKLINVTIGKLVNRAFGKFHQTSCNLRSSLSLIQVTKRQPFRSCSSPGGYGINHILTSRLASCSSCPNLPVGLGPLMASVDWDTECFENGGIEFTLLVVD